MLYVSPGVTVESNLFQLKCILITMSNSCPDDIQRLSKTIISVVTHIIIYKWRCTNIKILSNILDNKSIHPMGWDPINGGY